MQSNCTEIALAVWRASQPGEGTPVENYLRSRRIDLPVPAALRFNAELKHSSGGIWPVMVALVTRGVDEEPIGIGITTGLSSPPEGGGNSVFSGGIGGGRRQNSGCLADQQHRHSLSTRELHADRLREQGNSGANVHPNEKDVGSAFVEILHPCPAGAEGFRFTFGLNAPLASVVRRVSDINDAGGQ